MNRFATHYAVVRSSGRIIEVARCGRVLIVLHGPRSLSLPRYDHRFTLLPAGIHVAEGRSV